MTDLERRFAKYRKLGYDITTPLELVAAILDYGMTAKNKTASRVTTESGSNLKGYSTNDICNYTTDRT